MPLYMHVRDQLADHIQRRYRPGDILPSEQSLAKSYRVNRHTLRRAVEDLVTEGVIGKQQGKGMVVLQKLINYSIHNRTRFTETLEKNGRKAESIVLRKVGIAAQGEVAAMLDIKEGEPVALIETLRKMDGVPFSLVSHYLPLEKVYDVIRLYHGGSLHHFLADHCRIRLQRTHSLIRAVLPDRNDRELLAIMGTSPILLVKSVNVDQQSGLPIELAVSRFKGISTQLSIEFE